MRSREHKRRARDGATHTHPLTDSSRERRFTGAESPREEENVTRTERSAERRPEIVHLFGRVNRDVLFPGEFGHAFARSTVTR